MQVTMLSGERARRRGMVTVSIEVDWSGRKNWNADIMHPRHARSTDRATPRPW